MISKGNTKRPIDKHFVKMFEFFLILLMLVMPFMIVDKASVVTNSQSSSKLNGLDLTFDYSLFLFKPAYEEVVAVNEKKTKLDEEDRIRKIKDEKISKVVALLSKYKSPVANRKYAEQIIDLSDRNNSDYRVIVAIMGVESGFCRAPYLKNGENTHNCFGYLNGVVYSSFEDAFNNLVPKICRQYVNRYGWDFESLAKAYGQISWEETRNQLRGYASAL